MKTPIHPNYQTHNEAPWKTPGYYFVLEVADQDCPDSMSWEEAQAFSKGVGKNWRLPTDEELVCMFNQIHREREGNFNLATYWTSTECKENPSYAYSMDFRGPHGLYHDKSRKLKVRLVRPGN